MSDNHPPAAIEVSPAGETAADTRPGDFILAHRKGVASFLIRTGERIRLRSGARWSHTAIIVAPGVLVEALTHGVMQTPLAAYEHIEYVLVRTGLQGDDQRQAVAFARSCLGQRYGWTIIAGIALRFLTPGRGLWFGMDGTQICSGLVAQAQCRGWAIFPVNPSSITPAKLAECYGAPTGSKGLYG